MITVKPMGGIGNVLFQIAAIYSLARDHNSAFSCDFDHHCLPLQGNKCDKYLNNVLINIPKTQPWSYERFYREPKFTYDPLPYIDNGYYEGYFQSYKYFYKHRADIKGLFNVPPIISEHNTNNLTAVHVRRGDYLKFPDIYPTQSVDYYKEAMAKVTGNFIFCSDDMEWVRSNFQGPNIFYSPFYDDVSDLRLMKYCKGIIGSASTFSLWAGFLSPNPNYVNIFPKIWFGPMGPNSDDIIPSHYIRI